jgi:catechol 2,3-dioxygenase-like lactoylglutathione lyase family enzyme
MFLGLRTAIYHVADIDAAKSWYSSVLGFGPYFDESFYIGFNVGGYELGLQPSDKATTEKTEGVVAYWGRRRCGSSAETLVGARRHSA